MAQPFIDNTSLAILQTILDLAGPNFTPPYDASQQPIVGNDRNNEDLIQFRVPGGTSLKGYSEPSITESIGSAINSMLAVVAPFISAYGLVLPILGVIRGIIEVICAMMNPFAVIKAVIRLFKKWIPPFISIFPPFAGIILIISIIKTLLAIVYFIMTVLVPTIQLIIFNVKILVAAVDKDSNEQKRKAGREKLNALIVELLNQIGVLNILTPLLSIIFLILRLVSGFPCSKKKSKKGKKSRMDLTGVSSDFNEDDEDASCCDEDVCPDIISHPPFGRGVMIPVNYCESPPFFAMKIVTNNSQVVEYKQFSQNLPSQLNCQLDEEIDFGRPAHFTGDLTMLRVEITSRRGAGRKINVPVVKIKDSGDIIVVNPSARRMIGTVDWKIVPNYDLMIMSGFIGLACHPDVVAAKEEIENRFPDLDNSVVDRFPEIGNLEGDFANLNANLNSLLNGLQGQVDNNDTNGIQNTQDQALALLTNFANNLVSLLNDMLSKTNDRINSIFDVDKTIVRAGNKDKATLVVIPKDVTGSNLAQNLPNGVDIEVNFETNFGVISNKRRNNATGEILADITSISTGVATVKAKVASSYVFEVNDAGQEVVKEIQVRFVSDAILPTRRTITKPNSNTSVSTNNTEQKSDK
jgi:hypothetical protein